MVSVDGEREPLYKPPKKDKPEKSEERPDRTGQRTENNSERRNSVTTETEKEKRPMIKRSRTISTTPSSSPCNNTPLPATIVNEGPNFLPTRNTSRSSSAKSVRKVSADR